MKFFDKVALNNVKLILSKNSPSIFIGIGVAGVVVASVMACKATLKLDDTLDTAKANIETVKRNNTKDEPRKYLATLTSVYFKEAMNVLKLYIPATTIGGLSIYAILHGKNILIKRNVAIAAAYELVSEGFDAYRERVKSEFGEEVDYKLRYGIEEKEVEWIESDNKGGKQKKKEKQDVVPSQPSIFSKFFEEGSIHWSDSPEKNLYHCRLIQNYANDKLNANGHLFLNEVYDMLDIPRTDYGQLVGWLSTKNGGKDGYVDFGIYDINKEANRDFVNGYENVILLDFNVDGVIYDKI